MSEEPCDNDQAKPRIRLSPGPPATAAGREEAEEIQELARTELDRVRKSAESWRTGLAVLLTLITAVMVVKGRETITGLPTWDQRLIGVLLLLALASGAFGAFRVMRAAFGLPKKAILDDLAPAETGRLPASRVRQWRRQQSVAALRDLKAGIVATFATLAFIVLAVGFTWYVDEEPPAFVKATAGGQAVCGELKKGSSQGIIIDPADGDETTVAIGQLAKLQVVSEC